MTNSNNSVESALAIAGTAIIAISIPFLLTEGLSSIGVIITISGILLVISSFAWGWARAKGRTDSDDRPIMDRERWAQWPIRQEDRHLVVGNDNAAATEICFERHGPEWAGESSVRLGSGKLMAVKLNRIPFSERSVLRFEYEQRGHGMGVGTYTPLDIIFAVAAIVRIFAPDVSVREIRVPVPIGREAEAEELLKRYNALMRG